MTDSTTLKSSPATRRGFKRFAATALFAVAAATSVSVWAEGPDGHHGPGGRGMGFGGPEMMFHGSPERIDRGVDRMLDSVNGTDAQRVQIKQIVTAAAADLKAQREAGRALHEKSAALFVAPTIDPAVAESLRQQMMAQADTASRRVLQAMLDISRVLTPDQRAQLGAKMQKWKERARMHQERAPKTP